MKIIFGLEKERLFKKAQEQLVAQEKYLLKRGKVEPEGVAIHTARFPHVCDDCGETYWTQDEYTYTHVGCDKGKRTGF